MLTAYLFDERRGKPVEKWTSLVGKLGENQVLWVDLADPSGDDADAARSGFNLGEAVIQAKDDAAAKPQLELAEDHIRLTAVAVSDDESDPDQEAVVVNCVMGTNWVLTSHVRDIAVIEDFRTQAEGAGELGALDAPSFVATLLEWVVTSYSRAFAEIESTLDDFDISVLASPRRDTEQQIRVLVDARRRINNLRRTLAPHREIFATLSHAELDLISTERSADRFERLTTQTDAALASATETKNAVANSFDVLILRTEHRTNEIMKVLTLASILLLPGALIAGVMGMNVNFKAGTFTGSPLFWTVTGLIIAIALATLGIARLRRWI